MPDIKKNPFTPAAGSALALTVLIFLSQAPALAADWGYDDVSAGPAQAQPQEGNNKQAAPQAANGRPTKGGPKGRKNVAKGPQVQAKTQPSMRQRRPPDQESNETSLTPEENTSVAKGPTPEEIAAHKKVADLKSWMEIFALAASSASEDDRNQILTLGTLPLDTRKRLETMLFEKLDQNVPEYVGVSAIWRPISGKVAEDIDYKESYRLLFRSLLRHAAGRIESTAPEAEVIQEVLGPARIAEMGPPILTEDAINAYSDMTCFLYQKRHPDHTVEGDDNRQLFADVIRQKYTDAPNAEAKKAMCNFDVTWASFRCRYLDATASEKDKLIITISGEKTPAGQAQDAQVQGKSAAGARAKGQATAALMSPKLLKIFALGPWSESAKTIPVAVKMSQMSSPTK